MEALKTKGIARDGILAIPVPKEFDERELEVILLSIDKQITDEQANEELQKHQEKVKRLMSIVNTAKNPNFPITKYDVYDQ